MRHTAPGKQMNKGKVLVVDDNCGICAALKILLPRHFRVVEVIPSPKTLATRLRELRPDAVLLDMNFDTETNTGNEGLYWLSEIRRLVPCTEVVLFTAYADIRLAVEGMKRGAFDFVVKPYDNDRLVEILQRACDKALKGSGRGGGEETPAAEPEEGMFWGGGRVMREVRDTVRKIAPTDANVLITGDNGTGKDVLAGEIHRLSERALHPMVSVDVGAISDSLFESELFGHVKGSFTGAFADHVGKIEAADGGTLFLDEIGNIPLHLQAKLLRVLQNRTVIRVGDTRPIGVNIRLICATNRNLEELVREGRFREDLYYRINTIHINLPPLRERADEILPLARLFAQRYARKYRRAVEDIDPSGEETLLRHEWPGNIRELRNCIEKSVILSGGTLLSAADFKFGDSLQESRPQAGIMVGESLEMLEQKAIRAALEHYNGNLTMVAKSLEISRPTLYAKLKKYNI